MGQKTEKTNGEDQNEKPLSQNAAVVDQDEFKYYYAWKNTPTRAKYFRRRCRVLVWGFRMNTALLQFEDGAKLVTSRNAIRKIKNDWWESRND